MKERIRDFELRVFHELLKDSKRSDREIAKLFHVSQPTVTRTRAKLEKAGYIKQYTLMPDFLKLGYKIMAITFVKLRGTIGPEEREKARTLAKDILKTGPYEIVMGERGMGLGFDGVFVSYHESFSDYAKLKRWFEQFTFLEIDRIESFIMDLEDSVHYRPLDFSSLALNLIMKREKKEQP